MSRRRRGARPPEAAAGTWPSAEQIHAIEAPTLVIAGDSDIVTPEHVAEMFRIFVGGDAGDVVRLPEDQLAILPGTTHLG